MVRCECMVSTYTDKGSSDCRRSLVIRARVERANVGEAFREPHPTRGSLTLVIHMRNDARASGQKETKKDVLPYPRFDHHLHPRLHLHPVRLTSPSA